MANHLARLRHSGPANPGSGLGEPQAEADSDSRMQNKIRLAQEQKVPYMLVLGDREVEARTVAIRHRSGEQENGVAWAAFIDRLAEETAARRP
jgi:threonyl-tRNA synthetase